MRTHQDIVCWGAVLALGLVTSIASAQTIDTAKAVSQVDVVPRHNQWSLVDPQARAALQQVISMSAAERDQLIRQGNARERGIGLFVAEQQGDLELLLSLSHLLNDQAGTVPYALPVAQADEYASADQTVAEYLTSIYLDWFGVDVDRSGLRFEQLLGSVAEPDHLVQPWIVRLRRARADGPGTARTKQQIKELPEQVRWAVVTLGYLNSLYAEPEARCLLQELSEAVQDTIQKEGDLLPGEPLFRMNAGTYRKLVLGECRRLLSSSQE